MQEREGKRGKGDVYCILFQKLVFNESLLILE